MKTRTNHLYKLLRRVLALTAILSLLAAGMAFPTMADDQAPTSEEALRIGDADGNGTVNSADATRILLSVVGKVTLTPAREAAADVNGDGAVTASDATAVLLHCVEKKAIAEHFILPARSGVSVPAPMYDEKQEQEIVSVLTSFLIIDVTSECAETNSSLGAEDFPDVDIVGIGAESGSNNRWYVVLPHPNQFSALVDAVNRIQAYEFVERIELFPLDIYDRDQVYVDTWSVHYSNLINLVYAQSEPSESTQLPDGVAMVRAPEYDGGGTDKVWVLFSNQYQGQEREIVGNCFDRVVGVFSMPITIYPESLY